MHVFCSVLRHYRLFKNGLVPGSLLCTLLAGCSNIPFLNTTETKTLSKDQVAFAQSDDPSKEFESLKALDLSRPESVDYQDFSQLKDFYKILYPTCLQKNSPKQLMEWIKSYRDDLDVTIKSEIEKILNLQGPDQVWKSESDKILACNKVVGAVSAFILKLPQEIYEIPINQIDYINGQLTLGQLGLGQFLEANQSKGCAVEIQVGNKPLALSPGAVEYIKNNGISEVSKKLIQNQKMALVDIAKKNLPNYGSILKCVTKLGQKNTGWKRVKSSKIYSCEFLTFQRLNSTFEVASKEGYLAFKLKIGYQYQGDFKELFLERLSKAVLEVQLFYARFGIVVDIDFVPYQENIKFDKVIHFKDFTPISYITSTEDQKNHPGAIALFMTRENLGSGSYFDIDFKRFSLVLAHELGHVMGLPDRYADEKCTGPHQTKIGQRGLMSGDYGQSLEQSTLIDNDITDLLAQFCTE